MREESIFVFYSIRNCDTSHNNESILYDGM